jgi:hypothetical protein
LLIYDAGFSFNNAGNDGGAFLPGTLRNPDASMIDRFVYAHDAPSPLTRPLPIQAVSNTPDATLQLYVKIISMAPSSGAQCLYQVHYPA